MRRTLVLNIFGRLMYYVVYALLYAFSLLPLRVLYLFSDLAFVLLYHVFGYRKKVVYGNLAIAFPQKTEAERRQIAKKFYRNFTDNFIETLKLISASPDFVDKHFSADYSVFEKVFSEGRKSQIHTGHNFNWELANLSIAAHVPQKLLTVYMPLENKIFNRIFLKFRAKTGAALLPATDMRRSILPWRNEIYTLGLVADQSPAVPHAGYWINFFGRPTPFLKAPESGARIGNLPVIFSYFVRVRRGYYLGVFEMGEENPAQLQKGELTIRYVRYLEKVISENPEMWLWSHRRWKWEWKEEYGPVIG